MFQFSNATSALSPGNGERATAASLSRGGATARQPGGVEQLSPEERREVQRLQRRHREVVAHERAHMMAGRELVIRGADYTYEKGPDERQYAVAGEVTIDTSPVNGDPEATHAKAQRIRETALAPAQPSSQDRAVAAKASMMAMQARIEILRRQQEEQTPPAAQSQRMQSAYGQAGAAQAGASGHFHQTA